MLLLALHIKVGKDASHACSVLWVVSTEQAVGRHKKTNQVNKGATKKPHGWNET